jgi:hypothetical protein
MSANCSSVDFALEGGGVAMAAVKMNNGGGGVWWWDVQRWRRQNWL